MAPFTNKIRPRAIIDSIDSNIEPTEDASVVEKRRQTATSYGSLVGC